MPALTGQQRPDPSTLVGTIEAIMGGIALACDLIFTVAIMAIAAKSRQGGHIAGKV